MPIIYLGGFFIVLIDMKTKKKRTLEEEGSFVSRLEAYRRIWKLYDTNVYPFAQYDFRVIRLS